MKSDPDAISQSSEPDVVRKTRSSEALKHPISALRQQRSTPEDVTPAYPEGYDQAHQQYESVYEEAETASSVPDQSSYERSVTPETQEEIATPAPEPAFFREEKKKEVIIFLPPPEGLQHDIDADMVAAFTEEIEEEIESRETGVPFVRKIWNLLMSRGKKKKPDNEADAENAAQTEEASDALGDRMSAMMKGDNSAEKVKVRSLASVNEEMPDIGAETREEPQAEEVSDALGDRMSAMMTRGEAKEEQNDLDVEEMQEQAAEPQTQPVHVSVEEIVSPDLNEAAPQAEGLSAALSGLGDKMAAVGRGQGAKEKVDAEMPTHAPSDKIRDEPDAVASEEQEVDPKTGLHGLGGRLAAVLERRSATESEQVAQEITPEQAEKNEMDRLEALFEKRRAEQAAYVEMMNAQLPVAVTPWAMIPWSAWDGDLGKFLMGTCDLFPVDAWNTLLLPSDEQGVAALGLPQHLFEIPEGLVDYTLRFLTIIWSDFQEDSQKCNNAEELAALTSVTKQHIMALSSVFVTKVYGEGVYDRYKTLFLGASS